MKPLVEPCCWLSARSAARIEGAGARGWAQTGLNSGHSRNLHSRFRETARP